MPTCIRCEKVMKSDYKKIPTLRRGVKGSAWACSDRFCNMDLLDLKNGYEDLDGVWVIVNLLQKWPMTTETKILDINDYRKTDATTYRLKHGLRLGCSDEHYTTQDNRRMPLIINHRVDVEWGYIDEEGQVWEVKWDEDKILKENEKRFAKWRHSGGQGLDPMSCYCEEDKYY